MVERGEFGVSPPKLGRKPKVTGDITGQLAMQAAMMQASGAGEAKYSIMKDTIEAMTVGTKHAGTLDPKYTFRKARTDHPEIFNPVKAINDDDRQIEWMSCDNFNDWTNLSKRELLKLKMVVDSPGKISEFNLTHVTLLFVVPFSHASHLFRWR